jgi:hypothetical protein
VKAPAPLTKPTEGARWLEEWGKAVERARTIKALPSRYAKGNP